MKNLGDFDLSTVLYDMFNTFDPTTGALATLSGSGASIVVYKNNGTGESAAGTSLTIDFDGRTGCHAYSVDTSADGTFYSAGGTFQVVLNGGTVGSTNLAGSVLGSFTLRKDSSLKPTTAARTLDVSAGGEAGLDWANIGSPTTAVNLSATNIDVDQVVASVSGAVGSVTGAVGSVTGAVGSVTGNVGGNVVGSVASVTGNVGGNVVGTVASVVGAVGSVTGNVGGSVASVTGNIGGNLLGTVATVNALAADSVNALAVAASAVAEIQSGLATAAALAIVAGYIDTEIADIQSRLPAALVGGRMDSNTGAMSANVLTAAATAADYVTEMQGAAAAAITAYDPPTEAEMNARTLVAANYATATAVDDLPTNAEFAARTLAAAGYATAASQTTIEGKVDTVDTVVDGIAAKTAQLEFTGGGVEANIVAVIGDPVQENGSTATNWGGTP